MNSTNKTKSKERARIPRPVYEEKLAALQVELVKLQ